MKVIIISDPAKALLRGMDKATRKMIGDEIRKFQDGMPVEIKKIKQSLD
jgi:hypothetical protein